MPMTAYASRPAQKHLDQRSKTNPLGGQAAPVPKRNFEIAALRHDGSLIIGQTVGPAIDLFDAAFSAFAHGSLILTPSGYIPIEDLQPGDMVTTGDKGTQTVTWIGSASFAPSRATGRTSLVRITSDTFGESRPAQSLTLGPGARILRTPSNLRSFAQDQQLLTPAKAFVDGVNVIEVTPPTAVRLFHLCLAKHATINVSGIEVETFHPGNILPEELPSSLRDRFLSLFPQASQLEDFGPLAHLRAPALSELN